VHPAGRQGALDVWCTLPPGAHRRYDHRPYPGDVVRLPVPGGRTIAVEFWGAGPTVYLVHGWGGWRGHLGALVGPLVDAGYRVVAIDAPGHGDAEPGFMGPRRGAVTEMIEALVAVGREYGPAVGVVGHSLGTTVAARAVRAGLTTERLVLIAPNPSFTELVAQFGKVLGLSAHTAGHLQTALEEITECSIDEFDLVTMGADGSMPQTLVVHDHDDTEAPHAVGAAIAASWPDASLTSTDGLGHYRILGAPQVAAAAVAHLTGVTAADDGTPAASR